MPYSILFVCLGNICRSCAAEEIFRCKAAEARRSSDFAADSAGLIDYHEGELPDSRMRTAAARRGYKLTHHSRPVRISDFARFNLIVAMDDRNYERLRRLSPTAGNRDKVVKMASYLRHQPPGITQIPDPYYGSEEDFTRVVSLLEDACEGLLNSLPTKPAKPTR